MQEKNPIVIDGISVPSFKHYHLAIVGWCMVIGLVPRILYMVLLIIAGTIRFVKVIHV